MAPDEGKALWGGRFKQPPAEEMAEFTRSTRVDMRLLPFDLAATSAHAHALRSAGLLEADEVAAVTDACAVIAREDPQLSDADEDVHSFVERRLTEILGDTGRKIHAGRSRNDLVATDLRLWCRSAAQGLEGGAAALALSLCDLAETHLETVMPGYTHLQRAQPVSLGFHLVAHACSLQRDVARFRSASASAGISALGAGALAGTTLPLDPHVSAAHLDADGEFINAMDAVADRDFVLDLLYATAVCSVHLSRLGEEIVLWTSSEFGFARISDAWSTGSSMMPQKRNPDVAELVRGKSAPTIGALTSALVLLKGLPLAYNRDLQEDKSLVFGACDDMLASLSAMKGLLGALTFDPGRMLDAAGSASTWATDLAEALVRRGVPFRDAHETAGALVADLESRQMPLSGAAEHLPDHHPKLLPEDAGSEDPVTGLMARSSPGGTSPERVAEQIVRLRALLGQGGAGA